MQNADGTATCDRCGIGLPGYGVLHGMVITDVGDSGVILNLIVCYNCRPIVLDGIMIFDNGNDCNRCGLSTPYRAASFGILITDLAPAIDPPEARYLFFSRENGCRDLLLDRIET